MPDPFVEEEDDNLAGHYLARRTLAVFAVIVFVLLCYGLLSHADADTGQPITDDATAQAVAASVAEAQAYEQGQAAARRELAPRVADAYAQGQRDAMHAVQGMPVGIELVQACQALRTGSVR